MFCHLSVNHYALVLTQIYCRLKVGIYNAICSGCLVPPHSNVWSCGILCRLVIEFGSELDFLSILVIKKAVIQHRWWSMCDNLLRRGTFVWDFLVSDGLNSGDYGRCGSYLA